MITIVNNFTGKSTVVDASRPLTTRRIRNIRLRLCLSSCRSGDVLGARGPQQHGYEWLKYRADRVIMTGESE